MARKDDLAKRLADEIESVIGERLAQIKNPVIRQAIEEALRDQVYENLGDIASGQIRNIVDDSMDDLLAAIQGKAKKKPSTALQKTFNSNDNGGKGSSRSSSGGKNSPSAPSGGKSSGSKNSPSRSSGGKSSGGKGSSYSRPTRRYGSGGKSGPGGK